MEVNNFYQKYKSKLIVTILILASSIIAINILLEYLLRDQFIIIDLILLSMTCMILVHYIFVRDTQKTSFYLASGFFISAILLFLYASYVNNISYMWVLFSPIFIYYLLGFNAGKRWILTLFSIMMIFLLLVHFSIAPPVINFYALVEAILALFSISLTSHLFQKMNFYIDKAQKKEDEQEIIKFKKRMELALTGNNAGAYEWNLIDNSTYFSPQWKKMLGYSEDTVFPEHLSTWKDLVHPEDIDQVMLDVQDKLEAKEEHTETIHRLKHKDGQWIWILCRGYIQYDKENNPYRMTGIHTDITDQKNILDELDKKTKALERTKVELQQSNNSLKEANEKCQYATKLKSSFLANMSHEIRTPLNAINGFISLLIDEEKDEKKLKYLHIIDTSSHTLLNTINDILDISKIESGKLNISKINFNTYKEIMSTVELFQAKATQKNINLSVEYDSNIPEVLYSDILRIKQVISNLFSNAVKFTHENGAIHLEAKYKEGRLYISVTDNGIGIPEEKLKSIFHSFSQVDDSTVRKYGGTGLGLTISSQLIEMLDGEITVESIVDTGSTFFFDIPIREGRLQKEEEDKHDLNVPLSGKILLVEDIQTNQMFITLILQKCGLEYDIANDGLEAVEKFKDNRYDLILMDENMPNLNGIGATKHIREIETKKALKYTVIIALTANALTGDKEKYLNAGMDDYLSKPVEPEVLIEMLHKYLEV